MKKGNIVIEKNIGCPLALEREGGTQCQVKGKDNKVNLMDTPSSVLRTSSPSWRRGFTLIELLVVVLIIGILAAVALPQYNKVIKKAHGTEALVALESLDKALTSYYLENGTYEGVNLETLDLTIPELHHFKYEVGSAGEGSSPDNTSFKTQSGYDKSIGLFLHSPDHKVTIGTWWDKGSTTGIYCSVTSTSDISCGDYFNCGAAPRLYHPETSQSGSTFPAYYSGGDCRIK